MTWSIDRHVEQFRLDQLRGLELTADNWSIADLVHYLNEAWLKLQQHTARGNSGWFGKATESVDLVADQKVYPWPEDYLLLIDRPHIDGVPLEPVPGAWGEHVRARTSNCPLYFGATAAGLELLPTAAASVVAALAYEYAKQLAPIHTGDCGANVETGEVKLDAAPTYGDAPDYPSRYVGMRVRITRDPEGTSEVRPVSAVAAVGPPVVLAVTTVWSGDAPTTDDVYEILPPLADQWDKLLNLGLQVETRTARLADPTVEYMKYAAALSAWDAYTGSAVAARPAGRVDAY